MNITGLDPESQEFMDAMGRLMADALESPDGMRALAAAIAGPIEQEIKQKEISPLLLTVHNLPRGERPVYQKKPRVKAHWISKDGDARAGEVGQDEVEFPTSRCLAMPLVDVLVLKNGNIGTLIDLQTAAAEAIRKEKDAKTIKVLSAAVPPENTVVIPGGKLTEEGLAEAIGIIEDLELSVKYIVLRGKRFKDLRGWNLDEQTKSELRQKGVIKNYGTAGLMLTAAAALDEVLLIPDLEVGKIPVVEKLKADPIVKQEKFKTGWLVYTKIGHGVTRPEVLVKIKITP